MWKEAVMAQFEVPSQNVLGLRENTNIQCPAPGHPVYEGGMVSTWPRLSVSALSIMFDIVIKIILVVVAVISALC
jgi:hypothetical protein